MTENHLYMTNGQAGFKIYDISNKDFPEVVSTGGHAEVSVICDGIEVNNDETRLIAGYGMYGLETYNIETKANPVKIGHINLYGDTDFV